MFGTKLKRPSAKAHERLAHAARTKLDTNDTRMNESLRVEYLFSLSNEEVEAVKTEFDTLPERPDYKECAASGPIAAVEWALPALVTVGTLFFQGFFKKAGENTYDALASAIVATTKRLKDHRCAWTNASGRSLYSPITKVKLKTDDGVLIDIVFPGSSGEASEASLRKAFASIESVVKEVQELRNKYAAFRVNHYFAYGYDSSTEQLVPGEWQRLVLKEVRQEDADD
jgi:hypothetical protein